MQAPPQKSQAADQCDSSHDPSGHPEVARGPRDDGDVLTEMEGAQHPERGSGGVEQEKPPPIHSQGAGHDAVELAQDIEEPGERDGGRNCPKGQYSRGFN